MKRECRRRTALYLILLGEPKGLADPQKALGVRNDVLFGVLNRARWPLAHILLILKTPGWRSAHSHHF